MKNFISVLIVFLSYSFAFSQNSFKTIVKDSISAIPLVGVTAQFKEINSTTITNEIGAIEFNNIPDGKHTLMLSFVGYKTFMKTIEFPLLENIESLLLQIDEESKELDEIIVQGTRNNRTLSKIPTRVEVLTEEIDEAATMDPSKVAHLLHTQYRNSSTTNFCYEQYRQC